MDERLTARSCSNNKLIFEDLYSFIEAKVKEVCRFEIENLNSEASASYANELVISLQNENKDLQDKLQELESHHTILKQEANSLREKNRSLLTAIRLMSNELQNPNEAKCVPVTSTNLHEQTSECVNDVSPMHDKESPWVPVNNVKSKQRTKRQRSKKAKLTATANPAEPHRPPIKQNRSSHQNRETPNVAQQIQNPSLSVSGETPQQTMWPKRSLSS